MLYDIYTYENVYYLLYDSNSTTCACNYTDSRPMNTRTVKIHKGVDNPLKFRVFDSDRRKAKIDHLRISVTLINKQNKERVLKVQGTLEPQPGLVSVTIHEGQLVNLAPGFYDIVVTGEEWAIPEQPGEVISTPFYTDMAGGVRLEAEITDFVEKVPIPTTEITEWMMTSTIHQGVPTKLYYSSPIPANRLKNYKEATHSFTVQGNNFTGLFQVKGTLEQVPPSPSDIGQYFNLSLNYANDWIEYGSRDINNMLTPFTGLDPWTIKANVLWLVFYWIPTDANGVPLPFDAPIAQPNNIKRVQIRS